MLQRRVRRKPDHLGIRSQTHQSMILLDKALERRRMENRPVRVGVVGAGYIGRGITLQIVRSVPGMRVAAVSNRTLAKAERAYTDTGVEGYEHVDSRRALEVAVEH